MIQLVIYDIAKDSFRNKLADRLLAIGFERIQLSVYLGKVKKSHLKAVLAFAKEKMEETDRLFVIALDEDQVDGMQVMGERPPIDMILGRVHTLFL